MVSFIGKLVTLEPLDIEKHARGFLEVSQDEKIHEYVGNTVPESLEEVIDLLKLYQEHFLNWMILSNETREVIGILRISKPQVENGCLTAGESQRLSSRYWRKGHMKEAKKLLYPYVFGPLGVDLLYADAWEDNINSRKSLESYGYQLSEIRNELFSKTGKEGKNYIYTLKKEDCTLFLK